LGSQSCLSNSHPPLLPMKIVPGKKGKRVCRFILLSAFFVLVYSGATANYVSAAEPLYALNLYVGRMTSNHYEDFFLDTFDLDFVDSYFMATSLARKVGGIDDKVSFEIEGQVVKHFHRQDHWEFNGLAAGRWEKFLWDDVLDTSLAFGIGPSYATDEPQVEIEKNGESSKFLVYWMLELALGLPSKPRTAIILRLHHRSNAWGLVADHGGSNALALGLKYRF
jgi:hypothetical protein